METKSKNLQKIYDEAKKLSPDEKLELITRLTDSLQKSSQRRYHSLSELKGLGGDLWRKINSTDYLRMLREEDNILKY